MNSPTPTTAEETALAAMPDLVGTPDTNTYHRSNEAVAKWYSTHYRTIRKALENNAHVAAAMAWRDISTAPLGEFILVGRMGKNDTMQATQIDAGCFVGLNMQRYINPTHWMPLPIPPQTDNGGKE